MRYLCIFVFFCSCAMLGAVSRPKELRLLTLSDGGSSETIIPALADVNRMHRVFSNIAAQTGLRFKGVRLIGKALTSSRVKAWVASLRGSRTIAVVYYSGGDLLSLKKKSTLPSVLMFTRTGKGSHLSQAEVCRRVARAKVRLGIVMFDCYNKVNAEKQTIPYLGYIEPSSLSGAKAVGFSPLFLREHRDDNDLHR